MASSAFPAGIVAREDRGVLEQVRPAAASNGMILNPDQQLARSTAGDFARERLLGIADDIDERGEVPKHILRELAQLGFMGVVVPPTYGGSGLDNICYALVIEEVSRACASTGVILSVNNSLVCAPLLEWGTEEQKQRWLVPLAKGDRLGCFALSEPAAGSDPAAMRTRAVRKAGGWTLHGTKNFITNGASADTVIVFAQTNPADGHRGISAFVVDRRAPGLSVAKVERKLGIKGSDTAELTFDDVQVNDNQMLGTAGRGLRVALSTLDGGRIGIAAQAIGIARACLEDSVAYAKQREAFGRKIAQFQAIQWMIAEMATGIEAARLLTLRAANLRDARVDHVSAAAMAKLFASDVAMRAARDCVQIFGGYGYLQDFPAERHYRDAKITEIYEGTSEIMKLVIVERLLKD
jgi:butyryl-CoA dehydrogenase